VRTVTSRKALQLARFCAVFSALSLAYFNHQTAQAASAGSAYSIVDLGSFSQSSGDTIRGLNQFGELVGGSGHAGRGTRAFRLSNTELETFNGLRGADRSIAYASNEARAVVGSSNTATSLRAFLWTRGGGVKDLGTLPGDTGSEAFGINSKNQIVGYSSGPQGIEAVMWSSDGKIQGLGKLRPGDHSRALAINDAGAVVGFSGNSEKTTAFLWTPNGWMIDLGVLPGDVDSRAMSINRHNQVVGYSSGPAGTSAFLWTRDGPMKKIGGFPGADYSRAVSINERGEVVGTSGNATGTKAFLWTAKRGLINLDTVLPVGSDFRLTEAVAINDNGSILVVGYDEDDGDADHHDGHGNHEAPARIFLLVPRR
jgi:probable HAF family extracellular repeat protein